MASLDEVELIACVRWVCNLGKKRKESKQGGREERRERREGGEEKGRKLMLISAVSIYSNLYDIIQKNLDNLIGFQGMKTGSSPSGRGKLTHSGNMYVQIK